MRYDDGEEVDACTAGPDIMEELLERDMVRQVRRAVEMLGTVLPEPALILTLRYGLHGEPMTYAQIQAATGIKHSAAASRQWRGKNVLRNNYWWRPFMGIPDRPAIGFGHHLLPGG